MPQESDANEDALEYNTLTAMFPLVASISLLVFIAALALLFTGRYPRGLFDLIMGLNRWVYRVLTYVALMRDEYPPFRLDVGGREESVPVASTAAPPNEQDWTGGGPVR